MICPFCASEDTERIGHQWVCNCCARAWLAFSRADAAFLRAWGIGIT